MTLKFKIHKELIVQMMPEAPWLRFHLSTTGDGLHGNRNKYGLNKASRTAVAGPSAILTVSVTPGNDTVVSPKWHRYHGNPIPVTKPKLAHASGHR